MMQGGTPQGLLDEEYYNEWGWMIRAAPALVAAVAAMTGTPAVTADGPSFSSDAPAIAAEDVPSCVRAKDEFKDCAVCPEVVVLPPGDFVMGSPPDEPERSQAEGPLRTVTIGQALAVGKYEVTFAEWDACVGDGGCTHTPRDSGWGRDRRPVINVSWTDVTKEYLPWLSRKTGQAYRLLSEAEWEYAARAGTEGPFSTGATITTEQANFDGTSVYRGGAKGAYRQRTVEVGSFPPNAFGLHDMHGNVSEWVQDCYVGTYQNGPSDGSARSGASDCQRVMRGGSWITAPRALRSAYRSYVPSDTRFIYRGFRIARTLQPGHVLCRDAAALPTGGTPVRTSSEKDEPECSSRD